MTRTLACTTLAATLLVLCVATRCAAENTVADPTGTSEAQPQEIKDAIARFQERDFEGAMKLLKEAVKKNADLPPATVIMAQFYAAANSAPDFRRSLEQAVVEAPADPEAYAIMAEMAMRERRVTDADLLYQKANAVLAKADKSVSNKRKDGLTPRILSGLAAVDDYRENWAGEQKQLESWLKADPKSADAMQRLAQCLFRQKDAQGALEKLREAAKINTKLLTPEAILAGFYERAGDRKNAQLWMEKAIVAAPKDLNTRLAAAQWNLQAGQFDEAKKQASEAQKLDSNSVEAKMVRGVIALFLKDFKGAELYFQEAFNQSPRTFGASNNLAIALVEQTGDDAEAKKRRALGYAQNNVQQYPKSAEAYSTLGWVFYKMRRLEDAEKMLNTAVSSGQMTPDTAYYLARISVDRNKETQAKQLLEGALKSPEPFMYKDEAKALLEQLKK
jgi:Tfp pilus assembly protein PilF